MHVFLPSWAKAVVKVFLSLAFLGLAAASPAAGDWLIDLEAYHVSAHGQITCLDCHEYISDQTPHPDPRRVNQKPLRPERLENCLSCHDQVEDDLTRGLHGGEKVDAPGDYQDCTACHDPHYQLLGSMDARRLDPALPPADRCSACHALRPALPEAASFDGEDGRCVTCHGAPNLTRPTDQARMQAFCLYCHAASDKPLSPEIIYLDPKAYKDTPHADMACLTCHARAARYGHASQITETCQACHLPHDEKRAHDAHLSVSCEACHLPETRPVRDSVSGLVTGIRESRKGQISPVHAIMSRKDLTSCGKCHAAGNEVGAANMILPPKSVICMPCHAATFSAGDTVTLVSLAIFVLGMLVVLSYVFSGSLPGKPSANIPGKLAAVLFEIPRILFSRRLVLLIQALFWDVLLQRRLYRRSPLRWLVHSLIFIPFVIRFVWGLAALLASLWQPQWATTWVLLDKNHPVTAFVFDMTGVMILAGLVWAYFRDRKARQQQPSDLSQQDRLALLLIGLLVLVGFVLEGARITMTGHPPGASWAFVGWLLACLFSPGPGLTALYGYLWYAHAILGGIFIAYLPFSRLLHIILAPISLMLHAVAEHGHKAEEHGGKRGKPKG